MKKAGTIGPLVLLALSGLLVLETRGLPVGSFRAPQVGFMPFLLAILLACLSLIMLGQAVMTSREGRVHERLTWAARKKIMMALGALLAFAVLFEHIGYVTTAFLLILFLMKAVQSQRWWVALTVAALSSSITYAVFTLLGTPLPSGLWG